MAVILPVNTIGQTWLPFLVSSLRERYGSYNMPMAWVFGIAMLGAVAILMLPKEPAAAREARLGKSAVAVQNGA
jgi:hypothetical protein